MAAAHKNFLPYERHFHGEKIKKLFYNLQKKAKMKRSLDVTTVNNILNDEIETTPSKVILVEREVRPGGIALVNPVAVAKKSYIEPMELSEGFSNAGLFIQENARNKLDMIGKQMKHLQELMTDVLAETQMYNELHNVACNFVKKPGHVYHLYERQSGQRYFGMLSPEEWQNVPPHQYLGSWRLEADQSWTPAGQENDRYEGLNYIKEVFSMTGMRSLINRQ